MALVSNLNVLSLPLILYFDTVHAYFCIALFAHILLILRVLLHRRLSLTVLVILYQRTDQAPGQSVHKSLQNVSHQKQ